MNELPSQILRGHALGEPPREELGLVRRLGVGGRGGANLDKKLYCGFQEEEEQAGGVNRLRTGSFK